MDCFFASDMRKLKMDIEIPEIPQETKKQANRLEQ